MGFTQEQGGEKTAEHNHLSFVNTCEDGLLVLHFHLQVHVGKLVGGDLESVVGEKHTWKPTVTLVWHVIGWPFSAPVKPVMKRQQHINFYNLWINSSFT